MSNEKKIDDGGPAFPRAGSEDRTSGDMPDGNSYDQPQSGMSLRDWFAGMERTYPPETWLHCHFKINDIEYSGVHKHEALSKWRYEMADAMIAARKAKR